MTNESSAAVEGVAHDFNNIFFNILLTLEQMEEDFPLQKGCLEELRSIKNAVVRAGELNKSMLMRPEDCEPLKQSVQINDLVADSISLVRSIISKKAVLRFNLAENLPSIEADSSRLGQVFMNFLVNAAESITDRNGVIRVSTGVEKTIRPDTLDPSWEGWDPEENYVCVAVSDTGCGVSDAAIDRIFEHGFSTKSGARGLGLAQAREIVRQHRGFISVTSEVHAGTTVCVFLPVSE